MKVNLDLFELSWLLESCLRGSHLRSGTIDRFIDDWYWMFNGTERIKLYEWMLRLVYDGKFKLRPSMCGSDARFMARYNPDNQYELEVSVSDSKQLLRAYKFEESYWVDSVRRIDPDSIVGVRKLTRVEAELEENSRNQQGRTNHGNKIQDSDI